MDKWATKKINKIRRSFLWAGEEEAHGGKCLVNWQQVTAPKQFGGLGIKDVTCFGRALRIRWLWHEWDEQARPWLGTVIPCDSVDRSLFASCTTVTAKNGATASFWSSRWLQGEVPKEMAPAVFPLAWRKTISVREALVDERWMVGLQHITTATQLEQFVLLWNRIQSVVLTEGREEIRWNLNNNGIYSAKSAYEPQFIAQVPRPALAACWQLKVEHKVKFYMWLFVQNRNWTSDRLAARGWPHSSECCFCDQVMESAFHILLQCTFAKELWHLVSGEHPRLAVAALSTSSVSTWWKQSRAATSKEIRVKEACFAAYVAWHIWNERNMHTFQNRSLPPSGVLQLVRDDVALLGEVFWK